MELSGICKNADPSGILTEENIAVFRICGLPVALIGGHVNGSGISEAIHQKHHFHLLRLLFLIDSLRPVLNHGAPLSLVVPLDGIQLIHDHLGHGILSAENVFISVNIGKGFFVLADQRFQLKAD